jgi:hypothetical protein
VSDVFSFCNHGKIIDTIKLNVTYLFDDVDDVDDIAIDSAEAGFNLS